MKTKIAILILISLIAVSLSLDYFDDKAISYRFEQENATTTNFKPLKLSPEVYYVSDMTGTEVLIINMSLDAGFNYKTAIRISKCESQFGKYKTNFEGSSAYGLYQFMPRTWNAYCEGSIESDEDQIKCFIKLYNSHPNWWECK